MCVVVLGIRFKTLGKIRQSLTYEPDKDGGACLCNMKLGDNNALHYGIPKLFTNRLQLVQNAAAKLITGKKKFDHVTPLLEELHCLPVEFRVIIKIMLISF